MGTVAAPPPGGGTGLLLPHTDTITGSPLSHSLPHPHHHPPPTPSDLYLSSEDIFFYPVPVLYSGDIVTFDITPRNLGNISPYSIGVQVARQTDGDEEVVASGTVGRPTFDGIPRARLVWAWNTTGLEGEQHLTVRLDPDDQIQEGDENQGNNEVSLTIQLLPASERPAVEVNTTWVTTTTAYCVLHYMTGTTAERDISSIVAEADAGVGHVQRLTGVQMQEPFHIYLIDRVIGHGGYARDNLTLSYLDRHYAGLDMTTVVRHEATHVLDLEALTDWSPALMREGLAVWAAGGHFKPEPIPERAEALLELDWYIPLDELAVDFYTQQHEIGYMEGGAFVTYLVDTHGWDGFIRIYTSFDSSYDTPTEIIDAALRENTGQGLEETEEDFLRWLETEHPASPDQVRDVQDTVAIYDTVRRYQALDDPSAYFLQGWLPDPAEAERRGIVADLIRHPRALENVTLETMLVSAHRALRRGDYDRVEALLEGVNRVLEEGTFTHPLAADYLGIVRAVEAAGYEPQRVRLEGDRATVWATGNGTTLVELGLERAGTAWVLERW